MITIRRTKSKADTAGERSTLRKRNKVRLNKRISPVFAAFVCTCILATAALAAYLTVDQVAQYAYNAGFRGDGLTKAIAIAWAESSFNTNATNTVGNYPPGSIDRGLWEINNYWHSEVNDACAFDPACSANAVYRVSKGGTDWHEWSSYGTPKYTQFLPQAQAAADRVSGGGFDSTNPYVDGSYTGSEVGTATRPFRTIAAAVNAASATQAVTLHIKPYWYKETLTIHKNIHMVTNGTGTVRIGG